MLQPASSSHFIRAWVIQVSARASVALLLSFLTIENVSAQVASYGVVRPGDSVWEVSTRHVTSTCSIRCDDNYQVSQFAACSWNTSEKSNLLDDVQQNDVQTIIYVHGNWMPWCDARQRALMIYRSLAARSQTPVRLIAFSWPSEQKERPARDVISKKPLLVANSFHLANFINELPAGQPTGIIGYSFGAAIVTGSLHLLAGGALECQVLGSTDKPLHLLQVSLMAPAFDRTDLGINGHYSQALQVTDRMVNLYNSQDPILRRFRFFDRSTDPVAAGFSGLAVTRAVSPLDANEKVRQYDCRAVGRSHAEVEYYRCPAFYHAIDNALGLEH